jgi:hypothetical protein
MTMNLLPAVEAYISARIMDLAKFQPNPEIPIKELEGVRTLVRGLALQNEMLERAFNEKPCNKP